jgi:hypothetical protein
MVSYTTYCSSCWSSCWSSAVILEAFIVGCGSGFIQADHITLFIPDFRFGEGPNHTRGSIIHQNAVPTDVINTGVWWVSAVSRIFDGRSQGEHFIF